MEEFKGIYLLYGTEVYLLEVALKKIEKSFGKKIDGINYVKIDDTNIKDLISEIETPAFGYEKKMIIVKNSGILQKEGKKKNVQKEELIKIISNYIEQNIRIYKR